MKVWQFKLGKSKTFICGLRRGIGLGIVIDKYTLTIDLGPLWLALEW